MRKVTLRNVRFRGFFRFRVILGRLIIYPIPLSRLVGEKQFFIAKNLALSTSWDAPHIWLHHGTRPIAIADMKSAINDICIEVATLYVV